MVTRVGCKRAVILSFLIGMIIPAITFLVAIIALVSLFWDMAPIAVKLFFVMAVLMVALPLFTILALDLMDELEKCEYS